MYSDGYKSPVYSTRFAASQIAPIRFLVCLAESGGGFFANALA